MVCSLSLEWFSEKALIKWLSQPRCAGIRIARTPGTRAARQAATPVLPSRQRKLHLQRFCAPAANRCGARMPKQHAKYNAGGGERHAFRDQQPEKAAVRRSRHARKGRPVAAQLRLPSKPTATRSGVRLQRRAPRQAAYEAHGFSCALAPGWHRVQFSAAIISCFRPAQRHNRPALPRTACAASHGR